MSLPKRTQDEDGGNHDLPVLELGKTTVFGTPLDANVASALAYLPLGPFALAAGYILLNSPSENATFNRYHAMQSLVFSGAVLALFIANNILCSILLIFPLIGPVLAMLCGSVGGLLALAYMIIGLKLAFDTYSGKTYRLPFLSTYVDNFLEKSK
ncbi:hypothetical protein BH11CYA1_BH11CYA1_40960 [soil metagenome]